MLLELHILLYGSVGHATAMATLVTSERTPGVSGTNMTRALPPALYAGPGEQRYTDNKAKGVCSRLPGAYSSCKAYTTAHSGKLLLCMVRQLEPHCYLR